MSDRHAPFDARPRGWLPWVLALVLLVQGFAGALARAQGPLHRHVDRPADAAAGWQAWADAWRHLQSHVRAHAHAHEHGHGHDRPALTVHADAQRHHHPPGRIDVQGIGGDDGPDHALATLGAALALTARAWLPPPAAARHARPSHVDARWRDAPRGLPRRPPRR